MWLFFSMTLFFSLSFFALISINIDCWATINWLSHHILSYELWNLCGIHWTSPDEQICPFSPFYFFFVFVFSLLHVNLCYCLGDLSLSTKQTSAEVVITSCIPRALRIYWCITAIPFPNFNVYYLLRWCLFAIDCVVIWPCELFCMWWNPVVISSS